MEGREGLRAGVRISLQELGILMKAPGLFISGAVGRSLRLGLGS